MAVILLTDLLAWLGILGLFGAIILVVGDTEYGYVTALKPGIPDENIIMALRMIHGAGGWEAAAKAVNLSPTSVKRLGVKKYGDLRDTVLQVCADQVPKEEWKGMKSD